MAAMLALSAIWHSVWSVVSFIPILEAYHPARFEATQNASDVVRSSVRINGKG